MPEFCECPAVSRSFRRPPISAEDLEHHRRRNQSRRCEDGGIAAHCDLWLAARGRRSDPARRRSRWASMDLRCALSPASTEADMTDRDDSRAASSSSTTTTDTRYTLTLYLELEGYADIQIAEDGEQAIARLDKQDFDVVLLDVMMPKVDGYQVLIWLKDQRRLHDLPVIMIGAQRNDQRRTLHRTRCGRLPAQAFQSGAAEGAPRRLPGKEAAARPGERPPLPARAGAGGCPRSADEHAAAGVSPAGAAMLRWTYGASSIPRGKSAATSMISSLPGTNRPFLCRRRLRQSHARALSMARTKSLIRIATELMREREGVAASPAVTSSDASIASCARTTTI